jgi:ATP/maltotriose-dependent transcriptional regulator MalT
MMLSWCLPTTPSGRRGARWRVRSPAGYGKTVFATMVAAGSPASWYTLTRADRDVQVFLVHLLAALGALCPEVADRHGIDRAAARGHPGVDGVAGQSTARGPGGDLRVPRAALADQGPEVRRFLEQIACLRDFDLDDCTFMMNGRDCGEMLERVARSGLFCSNDGRGRYRFHHLLREAILRQSSADQRSANHHLAAQVHRRRGRLEDALQHALEAEEYEEAAADLERLAPALMFSGRYPTFLEWLHTLPAAVREGHPRLLLFSSRAHRLISRFERSLSEAAAAAHLFDAEGDVTGWFDAKAEATAVYLDIVQPAPASPSAARGASGCWPKTGSTRATSIAPGVSRSPCCGATKTSASTAPPGSPRRAGASPAGFRV